MRVAEKQPLEIAERVADVNVYLDTSRRLILVVVIIVVIIIVMIFVIVVVVLLLTFVPIIAVWDVGGPRDRQCNRARM